METETTLAAGIRAADEETRYDAVCKELLSEKVVLAWILKTCAVEFAEYDVSEIAEKFIEGTPVISAEPVTRNESAAKISGMGQVDSSIMEGTVTYDIYFRAVLPKGEGVVELIVNVEAQGGYKVPYPLVKRGVYYSCRMVSAQYGREFIHSHYEKVKKVYSIWICTNPSKKRRNSISSYSMAEKTLVGNTREKREHYDLQTVVMVWLGDRDGENYEGLLKLLGTLLSTEETPEYKKRVLGDEFHIPMTETLEGEVSEMCNLSQDVLAKGREQGIQQGIQQGVRQGWDEAIVRSAKSLMKKTGWSVREALSALEIPEAERDAYAEKIMAR